MLRIKEVHLTTREELRNVPVTEKGNRSNRWMGVQHGEFIDALESEARTRRIEFLNENWNLSKDGADLVGSMNLVLPNDMNLPAPTGMDFAIGIRHSNAGRSAIQVGVGATVFICTNGCFSAEYILKRKHTSGLVIADLAIAALDIFLNGAPSVSAMVGEFQSVAITDDMAAWFILQATQKILPSSYAGDVWTEWVSPQHDDFAPRTVWSLYNGFTEVAKKLTPVSQYRLLRGLPELLRSDREPLFSTSRMNSEAVAVLASLPASEQIIDAEEIDDIEVDADLESFFESVGTDTDDVDLESLVSEIRAPVEIDTEDW